jgi:hypothetical protein
LIVAWPQLVYRWPSTPIRPLASARIDSSMSLATESSSTGTAIAPPPKLPLGLAGACARATPAVPAAATNPMASARRDH